MARVKKNDTALTLEEKLEQALIPDWEWPYKLPENWRWTPTGTIAIIRTGKKDANYGNESGQYPFFTCAANPIRCNDYSFDCDAIILAGNGDIGNISKYSGKFEAYQRTYVVEIKSPISIDYIYYYFRFYWYDYNKNKLFGTAIPYIRLGNLQSFPIPLPPFAEQKRIVNRIESLFAKLDEAKEKAQATLDSFETRKASILHKAFSGELTAEWRKKHERNYDSWKSVTLQDVCEKIVCGKTPTEYISKLGEVPFLKVYNITDNQIDFETTPQFIPESIHSNKLRSSILKPNDVVMNIVGPPLRKIAVVPDTYPEWNMNQAIVRFRPLEGLKYKFLYYALINPATLDEVISKTKGVVGQANISVSQARNLTIKLPREDEQAEIIHILDNAFTKEKQAKEAAEAVLEQIDLMKKAILSRAFRGELGTNDPNEESALELLKQVLGTEVPNTPRKRSKSISKDLLEELETELERKIVQLYFRNETTSIPAEELLSVSSKKFAVLETLYNLEQRRILTKLNNGNYKLLR